MGVRARSSGCGPLLDADAADIFEQAAIIRDVGTRLPSLSPGSMPSTALDIFDPVTTTNRSRTSLLITPTQPWIGCRRASVGTLIPRLWAPCLRRRRRLVGQPTVQVAWCRQFAAGLYEHLAHVGLERGRRLGADHFSELVDRPGPNRGNVTGSTPARRPTRRGQKGPAPLAQTMSASAPLW